MGRHRRSAAGSDDPQHSPAHPPAGERPVPADIGPYPAPDAYAEATAKAQAYLFATADEPAPAAPGSGAGSGDGGDKASGGDRRWAKTVRPVRAALLGVSVAVVLGTAAVGSGAVPGLEHYRFGGGTHTTGGERTGAVASPGNTASGQGGTTGSVGGGGATAGSGDGDDRPTRSSSPSPSGAVSASKPAPAAPAPARTATGKPSPKAGPRETPGTGRTKPPAEPTAPAGASGPAKPSASGTPAKPAPEPEPSKPESSAKPTEPKATPSRTATPSATPSRTPGTPAPSSPADTVAREAAVEAEVLKLVNDERAKAGLGALAANSALTGLAEAFSDDMAARGFFAHTDPDGRTPWDRAARAGITGLGAENIGRGQADAAAVLAAWMDSPENRANILNPGFTAVGAGVHLGPGGPWWTLEFGT
ncbi:CAP domain-containing protein [Streptomyces sp. CSDS2]|uniref:CAP domain-containing protein n=1 Tax=Streptomyces sp. CSDS2 TaxID=3055051 RepID=UPI0025B1CC59|nr:CAP domain-containing protein [Streptomyces sp. CSDS2]MDN3264428.1 CAP domain-containing protein [Streptomyces sp. CSDS2]